MNYRPLSDNEIGQLEKNGCSAEDWKRILVKDGFDPVRVARTRFAGDVRLGVFKEKVNLHDLIAHPSGIYDSHIVNSTIGDDVLISNARYLVNYEIEEHVVIDHVSSIIVSGESAFGNGIRIDVLNEAGGRELMIYDKLSAQVAYLLVTYRHDPAFTNGLMELIGKYADGCKSTRGIIHKGARIINCGDLKNIRIGEDALLEGCIRLEDGTVASSRHDPVFMGAGVIAKKFIVQSGSKIDSGALLANCFIGQGVQIGKQFSAENSAFFANCEGFHGETCSVFAGPYSVTHHKSTLLIAGMFSFYNAGSGTNQSNHMYKLGPVHQGILERGAKTGSFSYLLWPSRIGAFTAIVGKHYANFDTSEFPFSYITEENGKSALTPAMNLFTVGTRRDSIKWPNRDRRKDPVKYDLIHFELYSPYIVGKVQRGIKALTDLYEKTSHDQEYVHYKGINIKRLMLKTTAKYYDMVIDIFIGNEILKRLAEPEGDIKFADVKEHLIVSHESPDPNWVDISGLLAPQSVVNGFMDSVRQGKLNDVGEVQAYLNDMYLGYDEACWAWCADLIKQRTGKPVSGLSPEDIAGLISEWQNSSTKLNNMILRDAEKEFSKRSQTGFGIDGDESVAEQDFSAVRGTYENNKFVKETIAETERIKETAERWIGLLKTRQ